MDHSQLAVAGLGLLAFTKGYTDPRLWRFLLGVFDGILLHHLITEDIKKPVWLHINGSLAAGITLLCFRTNYIVCAKWVFIGALGCLEIN